MTKYFLKAMMKALFFMLVAFNVSAFAADEQKAELYFIGIKDGDTVKAPFTIAFGLKGFGVAPAGVERNNTGHHHLLINTDLPADLALPIPMDTNHRHFGGGQTEVKLHLEKGEHTLQLLLADAFHKPHKNPIHSKKIRVLVK